MGFLQLIESNRENQAIAIHSTLFLQLLNFVPRRQFERLAEKHHTGRRFRSASRWSQLVAMMMAQLTGRTSLRDVESNLIAQSHKLPGLGASPLPRSTLARVNEAKPYTLYEELFGVLLGRCQSLAPGHGFRFKNKLYSLDASTIDLCLEVFPWAHFRKTKSAVKLHVGVDHSGFLPEFVTITEGKVSDITVGRTLAFPKSSIVAFDRGYTDYRWYYRLDCRGVYFVSRLKKKARYRVVERYEVNTDQGVTSDQLIEFTGPQVHKKCPIRLRRIGYRDAETGKHYVFITNHFKLSAKTIANIYKARWQIELFFKWIKQNLKIKAFLGTSKNAVMTQIWIALCTYLLLALIKFRSKLGHTMQQILRLLQLNLFDQRELIALLKGDPSVSGVGQ